MQNLVRKTIAGLLAGTVFSSTAFAGTDTLLQFVNLSPSQVEISFPGGDSNCWYDGYPSDSRVGDYFGYYAHNQVSQSGYRTYLDAFKDAYGWKDLAALPRHSMAESATLKPAAAGEKLDSVMFVGQTSAALFDGCKLATSSRAFRVTLKDDAGNLLSSHRYVLQDPPDSQWMLRRTAEGKPWEIVDTMMLGAGGHGNPLEITIAALITAATVVTLGTATAELVAARAGVTLLESSLEVAGMIIEEDAIASAAANITARQAMGAMFRYIATGNLGFIGFSAEAVSAWATQTILGRMVLVSLADGVLYLGMRTFGPDGKPVAGQPDVDLPAGTRFAPVLTQKDYAAPALSMNTALADDGDRSVCTYATRTLALVTECRVVGIQLTVLPNGSLSFLPLPAVGSGG